MAIGNKGTDLETVSANRIVPGSIRASRVPTGALAGQFSFHTLRPRPLHVKMWPARAPTTAREDARAPQSDGFVTL